MERIFRHSQSRMNRVQEMDIGFHKMSFEEYVALDALNFHTLDWAKCSPEHLLAALQGKLKDQESDDLRFGRALHMRVLEPIEYRKQYFVALPCMAILRSGQRKGKLCGNTARFRRTSIVDGKEQEHWFCGQHNKAWEASEVDERFVLSSEEANRIEDMADKIAAHKVMRLLRQRGATEITAIWELDGWQCKGRIDQWIEPGDLPGVVFDFKKVRLGHARMEHFERSVDRYGYDKQAAWYVDGVERIMGERPEFLWGVIEEEYPYAMQVIQASPETLDIGRERYQGDFERYKRCMQSGEWPGYSDNVVLGGLSRNVIDNHWGFSQTPLSTGGY